MPPVVKDGAVILPAGLLRPLKGEGRASDGGDLAEKERVERLAMEAVFAAERALGREPRDVSARKGLGYDVESKCLRTGSLYFVEVKGRSQGQGEVTLTKNEILCSRNKRDTFRLAIVQVGADGALPPRYVKEFEFGEPDFAETTRNYSIIKLLENAGEPC